MLINRFISIFINCLIALLSIAFYTLVERKLLGYMQLRKGPNKVSIIGIPQPLADAAKLFFKEQYTPIWSNKLSFILAPVISLFLSLILWSTYPHNNTRYWIQFGIIYVLCVSAINVYCTFISGWRSNSKYSLLGALRGVAQTISYEISMSLILLRALLITINIDIRKININSKTPIIITLIIIFILWFITNLAETNRRPFDFAEGESELVSGFNVEYGSRRFALIFIAEYSNILFISLLTSILFLRIIFKIINLITLLITLIIAILFIWVRGCYPRIRYDSLIILTWKRFLPFSIRSLIIVYPLIYILWY